MRRRVKSTGISVGTLAGVRVMLHPSWFVVFVLMVLFIATSGVVVDGRVLESTTRWGVAIAVALLFFASVLLHELAHALVARRRGVAVSEITLFIFGGAANLEQEAPDARSEALIAGAGPLASLLVGLGFLGISAALGATTSPGLDIASAITSWLGATNLLLAIFNLIPGFPMDGGRLLRSLLWGTTRDFVKATRIATLVGRGFAYLLIAVGFVLAINGGVARDNSAVVNGVWLAFIGWFLNQAAEASYRRVAVEKLVEGIHVGEVMERGVPSVGPNLTLDTLVDQHLLSGHQSLYPVTQDGLLVGVIDIDRVRRVPRASWTTTRVTDAMDREFREGALTEGEPLWAAVMRFEETGASALPVVDLETRRELLGLITRDSVLRALRARAQLRV